METTIENFKANRQRHWVVTVWLSIKIIANTSTALLYIFDTASITRNLPTNTPNWMIVLLAFICIINLVFSILLLNWKKIGFWGLIPTSIIILIINLNIGVGVLPSLLGLSGVIILFGILKIKKDGVTTWECLE